MEPGQNEQQNGFAPTMVTPSSPQSPAPVMPQVVVGSAEPAHMQTPQQSMPTPSQTAELPYSETAEQQPVETYADQPLLQWVSAEYVGHHKTPGWFLGYGIVCFIIIAIVFAITRDFMSPLALTVGAVVLGMFAGRPPRDVTYQLGSEGFAVGDKQFSYSQYRSFSIVDEGALSTAVLAPTKRFAPFRTIYFDHEQTDAVSNVLEQVLPYEDFRNDPIDGLMQRIRF